MGLIPGCDQRYHTFRYGVLSFGHCQGAAHMVSLFMQIGKGSEVQGDGETVRSQMPEVARPGNRKTAGRSRKKVKSEKFRKLTPQYVLTFLVFLSRL